VSSTTAQTVHITKLEVHAGDVGARIDWLVRLMMAAVESSGVLSAEILPPTVSNQMHWTLVQCFHNEQQVQNWQASAQRARLLAELAPDLEKKEISISEAVDAGYGSVGSVAVAVVTKVKPGLESVYLECEGKFQVAQSRYPGYRGVYVQPPTSNTPGMWTTLIRFESPASFQTWFNSQERKKLLEASDQLVSSTDYQHVGTSFPGWFPSDSAGSKGPPNWKTAMLILLGLYPIVMLEIRFLMPVLHGLPPALANFIGNSISVMLTTWLTMPLFIKLFKQWLFPTAQTAKWIAVGGTLACLLIYALLIALLWRLL
jgi:uncharacterized protein